MNRFNNDDFNKKMDYLLEKVKSDYIKKVKETFLEKAQKEYDKYQILNNSKTLLELFQSSTFITLIEEETTFVMDYDVNHWADHVIEEINAVVNFEEIAKTTFR